MSTLTRYAGRKMFVLLEVATVNVQQLVYLEKAVA